MTFSLNKAFLFLMYLRCRDWKNEDHIWTGKVSVLSKGDKCIVRLEDPRTGLYMKCYIF